MENFNSNKEYTIGTIVNTKWGKAIVEKGDGYCGCCIFKGHIFSNYCGKCNNSKRKDKQFIYFKPIKEEKI